MKDNNVDLIDIIEKNDNNIIYLKKENLVLKINPKSIYKILSLISGQTKENLSKFILIILQ